jgi:hypothetical protein
VVDPLRRDVAASKLKLNSHPPTSEIVALLKRSPPRDETTARQWFEVLSGLVPGTISQPFLLETASPIVFVEFSSTELQKLSETPFVPVRSTGGEGVVHRLPPIQCYFSGAGGVELHSKFFSFVDFGWSANAFLAACRTRHEPSVEAIAQVLLADPWKFYELANGRKKWDRSFLLKRCQNDLFD